jgi:hypothetical protein
MEKYTGGEINNYRNREPQRGSFCIGNDTINHTISCETYRLNDKAARNYTKCSYKSGGARRREK